MAGSETVSMNSLSPTYTHRSSPSFSRSGERLEHIAPETQEALDVRKYLALSHADADASRMTSEGRTLTGADRGSTTLYYQDKSTRSDSMMSIDDDSKV